MHKRLHLAVVSLLLILATLALSVGSVAQSTNRNASTAAQTPPPNHAKVSMRQMGMGKMKNSQRWKAAIRRADARAAAIRTHGKGVK